MEILKNYLEEYFKDNVLCDRAFGIAKNTKYDGDQLGIAPVVYKSFDEKSATHKGTWISFCPVSVNHQLRKALHKLLIRKYEKSNIYSFFRDNIWRADLADVQLISKHNNKGIRFFWSVIVIFNKYA